ncbi:MAG TPA: carbon-nitrogen hydrolase family protein [Cyclobacteriaceae bacterium]|nr:carbon-nitrogen hydrolase family protein [Cyclobacteriaceae bacterium]HRK53273.1 carbon-nitrogen hydrolase family protein [Cyclobacteriaceae bacterium]
MFQYKAAVVQAAPILLDKQKTIDKIGQLVREAASKKAELILFPEVIIPGYPRGLSFGTVVGSRSEEGRDLFLTYWENAIEIPGPEIELLGKLAKAAKAFLVVGVTEKDTVSDTLYCTLIYFSNKGEYLGKHRKIKPTAAERIIWGEGDGKDLTVYDTTHGKIGGLICWENYMPLARMALYQQGLEIYLAPTADCRQSWQATMEHIAVESRCYVLGCNQFVTKNQYPQELQKEIENQSSPLCSGGSVIISPLGKVLAGPLFNEEGILYADIDHREIIKSKMDFDVIGHYNRPDIFEFRVKDDNG